MIIINEKEFPEDKGIEIATTSETFPEISGTYKSLRELEHSLDDKENYVDPVVGVSSLLLRREYDPQKLHVIGNIENGYSLAQKVEPLGFLQVARLKISNS